MDKQRKSSIPRLAGFFLSFFAAWIASPSYADVVNATAQTLQSSARVNRVDIDYTYTLTVHNTGAAVKNVVGTLTSSSPNTVVVDGAVVIANISANTTTTGTDTFTIRQNRAYPYNPADLRWSFTSQLDVPANHAPTANAGTDQTVFVGDNVILDGSISSDVDGNALSFSWSLVSAPTGSAATLSAASSVNPTFVTDKSGNYVVQLIVNDGSVDSAASTVTISTQNSPPVAQAGPDQSVVLGSTVQLSGVASSDVDGNLLNFTWSFVSRPAGSTASLSSATAVNPTFVADVPGTYVAQLLVNDGAVNSLPDTVTITTDNTAPVANAGVDQSVVLNGTAQLEGAASSDPEGAPLSYSWSFISRPSGSSALLSATNIVNPIFVADVPGTYVVQLIVSDGSLTSVADTVVITTLNTVPVANAGPDQNVTTGATVVLDGSVSSDADGNALFHVWSFTSVPGSVPILTNPASPNPSFIANTDGNYVVQLTVNDGTVNSPPDTVMITATPAPNTLPIANPDAYSMSEDGTLLGISVLANDTDADGNALTAQRVANVTTGVLTLNANGTFTYIPPANFNGAVSFSYRANDGTDNSNIAVVTIQVAAVNDAPTANAGADQAVNEGVAVTLNAAGSSDPENSTLTFQWSLVSTPAGNTATLANPTTASPSFAPNVGGTYVVQLIVNDGALNSAPDTVTIIVTAAVPVISVIAQDANAAEAGNDIGVFRFSRSGNTATPLTLSFTISGTATNSTDYQTITGSATFTSGQSAVDITVTPIADTTVEGAETVLLTLVDGASYDLSMQTSAIVTIADSVVANYTLGGTLSGLTGTVVLQNNGGNDLALSTNGGFTFATALTNSAAYNVTVLTPPAGQTCAVTNGSGTVNGANVTNVAVTCVTTPPPDPDLPPEPGTVAPPVDPTVASDILATTAFLYTGTNPIQTGVAPGTLELKRVAVLRGKVAGRDGSALTAVKISVLGHPEFGQTLTRADGMFDLAVNGGGQLTVRYEKDGFLAVQRAVVAPWRDYAWLPEIVMIPLDSVVTAINLAASTSIQVARGNLVSDADGARQATILFPAGTTATMVLPNGTTQVLTTLNVRATEYTVGDAGPKAMPAPLPPSSGYTYAAEFSVDEAIAAGASEVRFSQALPVYVENFIGFPVGGAVPTGYYDRQKGQWIASANGRVIKVLSITGGMADLDITGSGVAANAAALAALGVTDQERMSLATLYTAGQTLWRVPMTHFTPWDFNWPYGPPVNAISPFWEQIWEWLKNLFGGSSKRCGSVIGCEDQTLGESVPVSGTPWGLHYQSERTPGRKLANTIDVRISDGRPLLASLRAMRVEVSVAGRLYTKTFTPAQNLSYTLEWDGLDGYGRPLQGTQIASVQVHYDYVPQYYAARSDFENSFARAEAAGVAVSGSRWASTIALSKNWTEPVIAPDARAYGLGGWSLGIQHAYDPASRTLLLGDGRQRRADAMTSNGITTVAGGGLSGDGGLATAAQLYGPVGIAVGPDASLFIADYDNNRIRRVGPDGLIITTVAGTGVPGFSGDGGPATAAQLSGPYGIALASDGALFIVDSLNHRIRRVGPDGLMATVAGTGVPGYSGDGGLATAARLNRPAGIAVGPDGSLFIADENNHRIRRVGPDGLMTTVAGTGVLGFSGDGGPATVARLDKPYGVEVGSDGTLFIVDYGNHRLRRVGSDGIMTTVAGTGGIGFSGDGGPATAAPLNYPPGVAVGPDGSLFIADQNNSRIRRVGPDGLITTVAGSGAFGFSGDGGPATAARLYQPLDVAVGADGSLFIADYNNDRIRRVRPALPGISTSDILLPSEDGSELYVFTGNGRHLKTLDALTGALIYQFTYSTDGYLTTVTDASGNVTTVERSGAIPTAIVAPGGQRTTLNVGADGWLQSATNPASEAHTMSYAPDGLLQTFTGPRSDIHTFTYDALGRLLKDTDPVGGSTTLSRTQQSNGYTVTTTSALGRNHVYQVEQLPTGAQRRTITGASGAKTVTLHNTDGSKQTSYADGSSTTVTYGPDPRFGMLALVASSVIVKPPAGLTRTVTTTRTVTLADPTNVLSLTKLTDTVTDNGAVSTRVYNNTGTTRTLTTTTAGGRSSTVTLDALGRATQAKALGLDPVSYSYDSRGLLSTITEGSGAASRTTSLAYNAAFELTGLTDPLARTLGLAYDSAGRLVTQTLPDGRTVKFAYDAAGNTTAITPPGRMAHGFDYTPIDQTASYTPPDVGSGSTATQYSYDTDRALTRQTRPDGQLIDVSYDTAGRATSLGIARGAIDFSYDATTSKLTGITAPGGLGLSYSYDGDLIKGVTWSGTVAGSTAYIYNNDLRVTAETVNTTPSVSYTYDADGLLKTAGSLALTHNTQNGLRTGSTLGGTLANVTDSLTYNTLAELTNYSASYTGTGIYSAAYSQDKLGRITQKVETLGGTTTTYGYSYDSASRLSAVTKDGSPFSSYSYDSNGNRTARTGPSVSASVDAQDRLSSYGANTYSYTANGELLSKTDGAGVTSYQYDALGNLLKATLPSGTVIDYLIDGANRRVGKKVGGALVQGFLYQGSLRPVAELDNSNAVVSRFVYATHINVPDYMIKGGVTYRIITDQLGSPRLVVNVATGTVAQRIDYDEFGQVLSDTNPGFQPFGFAGGLYDRDTQLVRFGARDYDAETGRWTAKDPIGFGGGDGNFYAYVGGDPISRTDPLGLRCNGSGCWTTLDERNFLNSGNYLGYYQAACVNGDTYACFARHIAAADNTEGIVATLWLLWAVDQKSSAKKQCVDIPALLNQIRTDLANAYADYLPSSEHGARWPRYADITALHWIVFGKFGLPESTFGGTPYGSTVVMPSHWCPNCK